MGYGTYPKPWEEWKVQNCWMSKTQSSNLPCFALWPLKHWWCDDACKKRNPPKKKQKQASSILHRAKSLSLSLSLLLNQALTRHTWGFTLWIHLYDATRPNPPDPSYLEKQTVKTTPSLLFYNFHLHERSLQKISPSTALNW